MCEESFSKGFILASLDKWEHLRVVGAMEPVQAKDRQKTGAGRTREGVVFVLEGSAAMLSRRSENGEFAEVGRLFWRNCSADQLFTAATLVARGLLKRVRLDLQRLECVFSLSLDVFK